MGLAFFGLTLISAKTRKLSLYRQIHQICFHGKGGYDWHTVYSLPIYLRNFIFSEMQAHYKEEQEEIEKTQNPNTQTLSPPVSNPNNPKKVYPPNFKSPTSPIKYK